MRRMAVAAGGAAALAGLAVWVSRSRGTGSAGGPGVLPGRAGSWINAYLDRPLHAGVARLLELRPDDELLDVACGAGYFLTESAAQVAHVAGVDLSGAKVGIARRRLADRIAAGTAEVREGDAGQLPWETDRFTAISCSDAFPFFPHPERALAEMNRVLKPGGRAVVDMNPRVPEETESHQSRGPAGRFWAWSDGDARRMMEAAGFEGVEIAHLRVAGDSRLGDRLIRLVFGTDEETIVVGVKPVTTVAPEERGEAPVEEPVIAG